MITKMQKREMTARKIEAADIVYAWLGELIGEVLDTTKGPNWELTPDQASRVSAVSRKISTRIVRRMLQPRV